MGVAAFEKNKDALADVVRQFAACDASLEEARREVERLKRIRTSLPTIAGRKQALAEWQELAGVPALSAEFSAHVAAAERVLETAYLSLTESDAELARNAKAIAALVIPENLLAEGERIRRLYEQKSAIEKSNQDCARRETTLELTQQAIATQVEMVKPGLTLEGAAKLEPGLVARQRVQELAVLAPQLEAQQKLLENGLANARSKVAEHERSLNELPAARESAPLARLVDRARRELDFEKPRRFRTEIELHETKLRAALAALPLWTGSGEELEAAAVPGTESIEEMRAAFQESAAAERAARDGLALAEKNRARPGSNGTPSSLPIACRPRRSCAPPALCGNSVGPRSRRFGATVLPRRRRDSSSWSK